METFQTLLSNDSELNASTATLTLFVIVNTNGSPVDPVFGTDMNYMVMKYLYSSEIGPV